MRVEPFNLGHINNFRTENATNQVMIVSAMVHLHDHERAYTAFIDDKPILFAGIDIVKRSVYGRALGEAWIIIPPDFDVEPHKHEIAYNLAWKFKALLQKDDYYRLQAECYADDARTQGLLKKLGLEFEATFRNASELEKDTYLYARTYRQGSQCLFSRNDQASAA